jgi:hypothetical protein
VPFLSKIFAITIQPRIQEMEKLPEPLQLLPQDKKRETDEALRLTHIETLILLATTRFGREIQRENGVYFIIREAHLVEKNGNVSSQISRWADTPFTLCYSG